MCFSYAKGWTFYLVLLRSEKQNPESDTTWWRVFQLPVFWISWLLQLTHIKFTTQYSLRASLVSLLLESLPPVCPEDDTFKGPRHLQLLPLTCRFWSRFPCNKPTQDTTLSPVERVCPGTPCSWLFPSLPPPDPCHLFKVLAQNSLPAFFSAVQVVHFSLSKLSSMYYLHFLELIIYCTFIILQLVISLTGL